TAPCRANGGQMRQTCAYANSHGSYDVCPTIMTRTRFEGNKLVSSRHHKGATGMPEGPKCVSRPLLRRLQCKNARRLAERRQAASDLQPADLRVRDRRDLHPAGGVPGA